jgi:hypothetical protein
MAPSEIETLCAHPIRLHLDTLFTAAPWANSMPSPHYCQEGSCTPIHNTLMSPSNCGRTLVSFI